MKLISGWSIFIKERFEPVSHTLMIAAFASANATISYASNPSGFNMNPGYLLTGLFLVWLVFFHMRLFDDIKDYETDKLVNKDRPLPRGVLTTDQFGAGILACILLEMAVALILGFNIFTTYIMALAFTLIMRQEFFIGDWMRPKMELYATTHTFSASLLGMLIFSITSGKMICDMPKSYLLIAIGNWFVFNVFEFGRKTFSAEEEREGVDSYSLRLKPFGAFTLLGVNIFLAFTMLYLSAENIISSVAGNAAAPDFGPMLISAAVISFIVAVSGMMYSLKPSNFYAKFYRGVVSLYLIAYHVSITLCGYIYFK
ncbi:MAG TPA: UbiA family prenyltransferase [Candidatus Wallbacteria bacterium]|nr:UbiA family prenyltransferase [Candidatus Wallbacteria bacterium]